jgi:hypothetical protein
MPERLRRNNLNFFLNMRKISKTLAVTSLVVLSTIGAAVAVTHKSVGQPVLVSQTSTSGPAEIALAEHLRKTGAIMYGVNTCPYCQSQKQRFGSTAWPKINYVECVGSGVALCNQAKIQVTPTWFIKGNYYPGELSLFRLARLSGYAGATNFKNKY